MPFCSNCGTKVDASTKFCPNCGSPLGEAVSQSKIRRPPSRSGIIVAFDIAVGLAYVVLGILALVIPGFSISLAATAFVLFVVAGVSLAWFGFTLRRGVRGARLVGTFAGVVAILVGYLLVTPFVSSLLVVLGSLGIILGLVNLSVIWVSGLARRILPGPG